MMSSQGQLINPCVGRAYAWLYLVEQNLITGLRGFFNTEINITILIWNPLLCWNNFLFIVFVL